MPSTPNWKAILEFGSSVTEPRVEQVRAFVANLVDAGQLGREQAASAVEEILELGRRRADDLSVMVRREVERQLRSLGVMKPEAPAPAPKKAAAKPAKKAPAKKAPAKKAPAKKATASKVSAKNSGAATTAPKKPAAKKPAANPAPVAQD